MKTRILILALAMLALSGCATLDAMKAQEQYARVQVAAESQAQSNHEKATAARSREIETYYIANSSRLTPDMTAAIRNRWFAPDMIMADVQFSMGEPRRRVRSGGVGQANVETWYYSTVALTFVEEKLVRWVQF